VTGNETVDGTLDVTGASTLTGNVGIGGASGSEKLLVTGTGRVTSNLHVGGNLVVDGSFNFSEVIQNITTVNNEVIISTQLDISNQGTGPALKVSQFGVGDDQDVALFNAGDEGDAFKIDSSGNSHFYKEVNIVKENDVSFDTILIRRTDATNGVIYLRTLQVYVNNINILPSATNATQSIESGSLGDVIEFMTWNDLVLQQGIRSADTDYASRIRNNIVDADDTIHSSSLPSYMSLYIPLTQSFNISDIQSFVLYNRFDGYGDRINGFEIELYNRSNGFTPGTNVLYSMPINTTANVYRFDLPAITSYTGGFSTPDSQTQIKDITVSASTRILEASTQILDIPFKVEGGMNKYKFRSGIYSDKIYNNINFDHILSCSQKAGDNEPNGLLLQGNGETGLLIHNVSTTTGWFIGLGGRTSTHLQFFYSNTDNRGLVNSNTSKGYLASSTNVGQIDFTGQHRCFIKDLPFSNTDVYEGRIVCADQNTNITISGSIKKGNQAITQNETLPYVSLSVKNNDKSCFGVISASEDPNERVDRYGSFCTPFEKEKGDYAGLY